jgi:hypothetical protein
MKKNWLIVLCSLVMVSGSLRAAATQSADAVIEKYLAALGGREALSRLTSRRAAGTVTLSTPGGVLPGTVEVFSKAPNKTRAVTTFDLSAMGAGAATVEQLFDGTVGYTLNSMQGDTEITGNQLDNMRNNVFPTPLLTYKDSGTKIEVLPNDRVVGKDAVVLQISPKTGSAVRLFLDAETYLIVRTVARISLPQLGGEVEQTTDVSDYRSVDGVKVPFHIVNTNPVQTLTITLNKVEHNVPIDDAMFVKK